MPKMKWFYLHDLVPLSGPENMARDQHLLELVEGGSIPGAVLRIYRWDPPTLSLGYHQKCERSVVREAVQRHGFNLVRRWTGGRAVLHIREMTYSVMAPFQAPFKKTVLHNYELLGKCLKCFTDRLFLDVQMAKGNEPGELPSGPMKSTPCFASLSRAEIQAGEKKLIGSSQKLGRKAFLQHGSMPLEDHASLLCELTGSPLDMNERMVTLGGLFRQMGRELPSYYQLSRELKASFEDVFEMTFSDLDVSQVLNQERIEAIMYDRFGNDQWTFAR